jgi:hypothetical protein
MMRPSNDVDAVWLCRQAVDFRKGINGLSILVEEQLIRDPFLCVGRNYVAARLRSSLFCDKAEFCRHIIPHPFSPPAQDVPGTNRKERSQWILETLAEPIRHDTSAVTGDDLDVGVVEAEEHVGRTELGMDTAP